MSIDRLTAPAARASSGWRWALGFAIVVMVLTSVPYVVGYAVQGANWRFTGFVIGVEDGNCYIARMVYGSSGGWLFRTPYSVESQRGAFVYIPLIWLGKLAAPPALHDQAVVLFHLFRFGAGILAIMATYSFLRLFLRERFWLRWGLVLAVLGGGLGWSLLAIGKSTLLGSLPLEFYSPESFGFLSLYGLPHLALARALLLWGLVVYLWPRSICPRFHFDLAGILIGFLWLCLGLMQPLTILIGWAVLGIHLAGWKLWQVVRQPLSGVGVELTVYFRRAVWAVSISTPIVLYSFAVFYLDSYLRRWPAQSVLASPPPLLYVLAYGLALPLAIFGGWRLLRKLPWRGWLLIGWCLVVPALVYAPYNLQRRLAEGVWVVLIALAMCGLHVVYKSQRFRRWAKPILGVFSLATLLSTVIIGGGTLLLSIRPSTPLFRPAEEIAAFEYLADTISPGSVVLTAYETGNVLPAWVPARVVIGHGPETIGLAALRPQVSAFYSGSIPDDARKLLGAGWGVQYVFWGPAERNLGTTAGSVWDPHQAGWLKEVYRTGDYYIFEFLK